jgi:hypothetical protein
VELIRAAREGRQPPAAVALLVTQPSGVFSCTTRTCVVACESGYAQLKGGERVDTVTWLLLGAGFVPGIFVGRWWAERRRALFDMNTVWSGRRRYRG